MLTETLQGFDLSPQQRHIWSLEQPDRTGAFRSRCTLTVNADLDSSALTKALACVVGRHEVLRTRFRLLAGMSRPLQVISEPAEFSYTRKDLSAESAADKESLLHSLREAGIADDPDYAERAPLSVTHLTLEPTRHLLILELPSLYADAVSLHALARQIFNAYSCLVGGRPFTEEPVQYADIAETLNRCVESEEFDFGRKFWRERVGESLADVGDRYDERVEPFQPKRARVNLKELTAERLKDFCRQSGVTREGVMLTCWALLMSRLRTINEVLIGVSCDGRTHELLKQAVGPLSRHVPMKFELSCRDSFEQSVCATEVFRTELARRQHYFDPDNYKGERPGAGRSYELCFEYINLTPATGDEATEFETESIWSVQESFEIKLTVLEEGGRISCQMEYDGSTVSQSEVERLWRQYVTLLDSGLSNRGLRGWQLEIMTEEEKAALLKQSRGEKAKTESNNLAEMFSMQAARQSDRVAVEYEDYQLTYAELDRRSNQLAHYLIAYGAGPEVKVGILMSRSIEMIVAVLGVVKAGAAYVPLDESYPPQRLSFMLEDSRAEVVITEGRLRESVKGRHKVVCVDEEWDRISGCSEERLEQRSDGDELAYVIYTSGSTGRPKGVEVRKSSVANLATALQKALYEKQPDGLRVSMNAPLVFDSSLKQIVQILYGHRLVIVPERIRRDASVLLDFVCHSPGIDVFDCTPSQLRAMTQGARKGFPDSFCQLALIGGEALDPRDVEIVRRGGRTECHNVYGPTECTGDATSSQLSNSKPVTIGKPLSAMQVYVMDIEQGLAAAGVSGELYIGGAGVARGYLGDAGR